MVTDSSRLEYRLLQVLSASVAICKALKTLQMVRRESYQHRAGTVTQKCIKPRPPCSLSKPDLDGLGRDVGVVLAEGVPENYTILKKKQIDTFTQMMIEFCQVKLSKR